MQYKLYLKGGYFCISFSVPNVKSGTESITVHSTLIAMAQA